MPRAGIRRVRVGKTYRYMKNGRFVSTARGRAAMKRKRVKRNPRSGGMVYETAAEVRSFKAQKKRRAKPRKAGKTYKSRTVTRFRKPRKKTTKRKSTARRKSTTKKRKTAKRRTTTKKRSTKMAKSRKRSAAAKKAWRTRKRRYGKKGVRRGKKNPGRRRRRSYAKGAGHNPPKRKRRRSRTVRITGWKKTSRKRGGKRRRRTYSTTRLSVRRTRRSRPKSYRLRRTRKGVRLVQKNPMQSLKKGLIFFAGLKGMQLLNGAIKTYVMPKLGSVTTSLPANIAGVLPAALGFGVATLLLPKLKVVKGETLDAVKLGSAIALFESIFTNFVKPSLPANITAMLSDYVPYDNRLGGFGFAGLPAPRVPVSGLLGDYVPDNRYGAFPVTEALAGEEISFMNRGGAGGVFSKTVFGGTY